MKLRTLLLLSAVPVFLLAAGGCRKPAAPAKADALRNAYDVEVDSNDATHMIPLSYQQAQGKRIFYADCVWCHADATPAGPSNRSNLTPVPPLLSDGTVLNGVSDDYMKNIITLGGSALGKSAMMPPWGRTLSPEDVKAVIAYVRAVAQPPYQAPAQAGSPYTREGTAGSPSK
ncbi:MAG: cytochrome c [Acidobacteriia bacterium]|nr:cytochrome c [Terriglobia bacterium]